MLKHLWMMLIRSFAITSTYNRMTSGSSTLVKQTPSVISLKTLLTTLMKLLVLPTTISVQPLLKNLVSNPNSLRQLPRTGHTGLNTSTDTQVTNHPCTTTTMTLPTTVKVSTFSVMMPNTVAPMVTTSTLDTKELLTIRVDTHTSPDTDMVVLVDTTTSTLVTTLDLLMAQTSDQTQNTS